MRSMVEGARRLAAPAPGPLHPSASPSGPPPRSGEEFEAQAAFLWGVR